MSESATAFDLDQTLSLLDTALEQKLITASADKNIRAWLTEPRYAEYAPQVATHISEGRWKQLDDYFWTVIPFGTGGRRGKMYPIGSNAINERTIGESAQGLADYVTSQHDGSGERSCAIAYDTRHHSSEFAELCAEIMVEAGFKVYMLEDFRSTPELSFLVRYKKCTCGIMVTASHNPPEYNAVKVYWSTGGQVMPPHDKEIIDRVMSVDEIKRADYGEALKAGKIVHCCEEVDKAFIAAVAGERFAGPRDLKVLYSPLHGVGETAVVPALEADDFSHVKVFGAHREPNGDFPNVPNHVANPEVPAVFNSIIKTAQQTFADVILATDPDCDRLGCAAPLTTDPTGNWQVFTGNQIGALLCDYLLEHRQCNNSLSPKNYVVKTLVTTELIRRIADSYGVETHGNLHVGFKYIGGEMDAAGPELFVFGAEESHGFLVGTYARDKDAAVASMLMAELAAKLKSEGKTLHEKLDDLFWQHGCHAERLLNQQMPGSEGMAKMEALMKAFREETPETVGGLKVVAVRDYEALTTTKADGAVEPLEAPVGNMIILDLEGENHVAVRPSGTEPKVKFYMFSFTPAEQLANLDDTKAELQARLNRFEEDLKGFAAKV